MAITLNLYYTGCGDNALRFVNEMISSGIVAKIKAERGNLRYDYFVKMDDPQTVLLVDIWQSQEAIDLHHASPMMAEIARLRDKYGLHMRVERFEPCDMGDDNKYVRK